jgi:S1-C subfamily serine protease
MYLLLREYLALILKSGIQPDSPAQEAGCRGDLILSINDQPVNRWEDLSKIIRPAAIKLW